MALARKTAPPPEITEFEAAKSRWHEVRDRRRKLLDDLDGARKAFDAAGIRDRDSIAPKVREKIERFLAGRRFSGDQLAKIVLSLEAEVEAFQEAYMREAAAWESARSIEAARVNSEAAPAHRAIAARIAAAVQELSDACADEARLLGAVHAAGGTLEGVGTQFGTLTSPTSLLNRWRASIAMRGAI